jgi:hypothetical protein
VSASYAPVEECRDCLHRAGWSLGECCFGALWQVDGSSGEDRLLATGATQAQAWWRACVLAREVGMLAPVRGDAEGAAWPRRRG